MKCTTIIVFTRSFLSRNTKYYANISSLIFLIILQDSKEAKITARILAIGSKIQSRMSMVDPSAASVCLCLLVCIVKGSGGSPVCCEPLYVWDDVIIIIIRTHDSERKSHLHISSGAQCSRGECASHPRSSITGTKVLFVHGTPINRVSCTYMALLRFKALSDILYSMSLPLGEWETEGPDRTMTHPRSPATRTGPEPISFLWSASLRRGHLCMFVCLGSFMELSIWLHK